MALSRLVLPALVLGAALSLIACKKKPPPPPQSIAPISAYALTSRCTGESSAPFDLGKVRAYARHPDGTPSLVAVFSREQSTEDAGASRPSPTSFVSALGTELGPWRAGDSAPRDAELTACVDALEPTGPELQCSYNGATVAVQGRKFQIRILETATGRALAEETFSTDARVIRCAASVTGSFTDHGSYVPRLLAMLAKLEPEPKGLPKAELSDLDLVCLGTGIVQAKKPEEKARLHVLYFPTADSSFQRSDPPDGLWMDPIDDASDAAQYAYVLCVTGVPTTKKRSCSFFATSASLDIYDGTFQVELREARSAKVVESRTFKGTSAGCPDGYKMGDSDKKRILKIEPAFKKYLKSLQSRVSSDLASR